MVAETIKKGYKKTELGIIPENWHVKKISDFTDAVAGGTPSTYNPDYWGGDIRWMNSGELNLKRIYDVEGRITKEGLLNSSTQLIPPKCILIGLAGQGKTRGTVAINYVQLCTNQSIGAILPANTFSSEYIFYNLENRYNELRSLSTGDGGRGGLNLTILRNLEVPLPNLKKEQENISRVLFTIDNLIYQLNILVEKKKNVKKGIMQELFSCKKRVGNTSKKWEEKELDEIGDITGAGVDKKIINGEQPVRLVNFLDVYHNDFIYSNMLNFWVTASNKKIASCSVKKGDIFFTPSSELRDDIGFSAVAMEDISDATYSYHVVRFRLKENWDVKFSSYIFNSGFFLNQTKKVCEGSGKRYVINLKRFKQLKIRYPKDINEQREIADILFSIDSEIVELKRKRDKYKQLKIGMMQQLLTGRIRLK